MRNRVLAILLTLSVLCAAMPMALSSAADVTTTEVTTDSNIDKIIAPENNVLTKAQTVTYTKGDGGTNANGWKDTSTLFVTSDISAVAYDGKMAPESDTWRVRDGVAGEIWLQYDYAEEVVFDSFFLAGNGTGQYGVYGFDVYVSNVAYADLTTQTPVYHSDDILVYGRHIQLDKGVIGRYVIFRFGGCIPTIDKGNVGKIWVSELAATGREAYPNVLTEIDTGINEDKTIAPENNVLTKAQKVTYTKGDGGTNANGWKDTYTVTATEGIASLVYDGVLFGAASAERWAVKDSVAGEIWLEYDFGEDYIFDSFLLAGTNSYSWYSGGQGIYGFDVYIGDKSFATVREDSSIKPVYSTSAYVIKGHHVQLGKAATGRYLIFRFGGFPESWNTGTCWITELAATGHVPYPDVVSDITVDSNTDKLLLSHQNVLAKATNIAYTKAGEVIVPDTMMDGQASLSAGGATIWAPSNEDTYNVWVQYDFGEEYTINSLLLAGSGNSDWDNGGLGIYGFDVYVGSAAATDLMADAAVATPVYSTTDTICYARRVDLGKTATGRYVVFRLGGFTKTWNVGQCWISEMAAIGRAVNASSNISAMANVHVPNTGIVNPPVVVQQVTNALPAMDKSLPAVAVMDIDDQLNVLNGEGVAFTTVDEFCQQYSANVIGAYVVDSTAEVTALTAYLTENGVMDAYVFAAEEDIALATAAKQAISSLRCGMICDTVGEDETAWAALCAKVHNDTGVTQVLSKAPLSMDAVTYFNNHIVAAWSMAADTADVYKAISAGYHAVVATDPALVYGVYESITATTVSGRPLPIAHRGTSTVDGAPAADAKGENTIEAFKMAYDYGCLGVETDLRITKRCDIADHDHTADCEPQIVLHHDWQNLKRTTDVEDVFPHLDTENLSTKAFTMTQLRTLTVDHLKDHNGWTGKMCTLDEALKATEELGLVYYCHINDVEVLEIFNRLLDEHPEYVDNCIVFVSPDAVKNGTFDKEDVTAPVPFLFGQTDDMKAMVEQADQQKVLQDMRTVLNPYDANPIFYTYLMHNGNDDFYYKSAARGFMTFHSITNDNVELNKALLIRNGAVGVLTDTMTCVPDWHTDIHTVDSTITMLANRTLKTTYIVNGISERLKAQTCSFVQLSGPALTYSAEQNGYIATEKGKAVIVYYYDRETVSGATYRIYSTPVTVEIGSTADFIGAQVRGELADGAKGALRFAFDLPCEGVGYVEGTYKRDMNNATIVIDGEPCELVDFGAVVSIDGKSSLTHEEATSNRGSTKIVPANNLYSVKEDYVRYTAVVIGIPANRRDTPIYACSYATYRKDGVETTVYGPTVCRTIENVWNDAFA